MCKVKFSLFVLAFTYTVKGVQKKTSVSCSSFVLFFQGKFEEALQVVEGPLGEKLVSYVFVPSKRASLLMKLARWKDSNILYKLLLREE